MYYDIFLLGCLMEEPYHGYNIKKKLTERFDVCTTINNNTLYSLLKGYEKSGVITKTVELVEGKPSRNVYHITEQGRGYFVEILRTIPEALMKNRDEFMMRLFYFHLLDIPTREKLLKQREHYILTSKESVKSMNDLEDTVFIPKRDELSDFHLGLLDLELKLIERMKQKIQEPCPITDAGELV